MNKSIDQFLINLQVVDGPDPKPNCESQTAYTEEENRSITSIKGRSDNISYFLCIATTRTRALRAPETHTLFFKKQTGAFPLEYAEQQPK